MSDENMSEAGITLEISSEVINHEILSGIKVDDLLSKDEIPVWLNEEYFENLLNTCFQKSDLRVKALIIKRCGGQGENYASKMYRVGTFLHEDSKKETQLQSFIVKTLPENDLALEKLGSDNFNVQNKEMEIYETILPELEHILNSIGENDTIFPKIVAVDRNVDAIILEDLQEKNFVMADRTQGLDLKHILLALRKLAKMHAASLVMHERNPKAFNNMTTGFFTRKTSAFHVMFQSLLEAMTEEVNQWPGYEHYAKKLYTLQKTMIKSATRAFDCDDGDLHVLTHGDLWVNNLMLKYDENNNPIDAVMLDFQFACYGSPALDLIYFLFTSATNELRQHKMEELFQYYYYQLKDILTRLQYKMKNFPTLHAFQIQIMKKYIYVLTSSLLVHPVMISKDKDADFEALMSLDNRSKAFKARLFQNPKFKEVASYMLPMLDRKGILDEM